MKNLTTISIVLLTFVLAGCKKDKDTDPKVPVLVKIERIEISGWPTSAPDGSGWDPFDAPDIYVKVFEGNTLKLETNFLSNVSPGITIVIDDPISFTPSTGITLELWDHDSLDPHDLMASTFWLSWTPADGEETVFTTTAGLTVKRIQSYVY